MQIRDMMSVDLVDEVLCRLPGGHAPVTPESVDYIRELMAEVRARLEEHARMRYDHYARTGRWP